jgi:hypothetical protein
MDRCSLLSSDSEANLITDAARLFNVGKCGSLIRVAQRARVLNLPPSPDSAGDMWTGVEPLPFDLVQSSTSTGG